VLVRAGRLIRALAAASDKQDWLADKLAWRRFWKRLPAEHRRNLAFDDRYGVSTANEVPLIETGVARDRAVAGNGVYRPLWEPEFHEALRRLQRLEMRFEEFTFVDLGSGKGKLLLLAAHYRFSNIIGVEYSPGLHAIAEQNVRLYRCVEPHCPPLQTVLCDAVNYPLPAGPVLCFIFNSFDRRTMRSLMHKLDCEAKRPAPVYVAYVNVRRVGEIGDATVDLQRLRPVVHTRTLLILRN
jgi:SAM-dependent methyltransferase